MGGLRPVRGRFTGGRQLIAGPLCGVVWLPFVRAHFLRIVFALTLPLGLFWGLGILLDAQISQGIGWGPFFAFCAAGSLILTLAVALSAPAWLKVPDEASFRAILVTLLAASAVSYILLCLLLGLALAFIAPPDEHAGLIALWLPLWWMVPLGALGSSHVARRTTRQWS